MSIPKIEQNNTEINSPKQESNIISEPRKNNFSFYKETKILKKLISQEQTNKQINENKIHLLEQQLAEINKIHSIYKKYKKNTYTKNSQLKLDILFSGIESKIGNTDKEIINDGEKIRDILKNEIQRLSDTPEDDTYRDYVEENIDFLNLKKDKFGLETQDTTNFLHLFTIKYIDHIEQCSLPKQKPSDSKSLEVDRKELIQILIQVFKEIGRIPKDLEKLKFKIKNSENVIIESEALLKGKQDILGTKEQIKDVQEKLQKLGFYTKKIDGEYESMKTAIEDYQELHDIIPRGGMQGKGDFGIKTKLHLEAEYSLYLEAKQTFTGEKSQELLRQEKKPDFLLGNFLRDNRLPETAEKIFMDCLERYKIFDEVPVEEAKKEVIENISTLLRFILSMESGNWYSKEGGNLQAKSKISSAGGALQILNGFKDGIKIQSNSSFITKLRRNVNYYPEKGNPKWFDIIYDNAKYNNKNIKDGEAPGVIISPLDLTAEQTIIIWMIAIFESSEKARNAGEIRGYLKGILTGGDSRQRNMRDFYENTHHTRKRGNFTNKKTEKLTTKKIGIFGPKLHKKVSNRNNKKIGK